MAPAEAFGHLASVVRAAAPAFQGKYVLFLLDDVSTRYIHQDTVREVISRLLFQHSFCAFRITTETQALHRVIVSPGGSEPADPTRDYDEFNLGNEVYRLLQEGSTRRATAFVSEILRRRGLQFNDPAHKREPVKLLGDTELEQIATEIVDSSESSPERKHVYRGLRALQAVCVGDLGDVVKLYEKILQKATPSEEMVAADKQSACFLEHSANLMHFLNRRDQHKKGLASAFAQAAGEALQRSAKSGGARRLRQYTKLYVRVDSGPDYDVVANHLLALLDAGVFVYDSGTPRTKTRADDPVLQFKLSYRKMLGLASYIGLSDRDRFELSGTKLRRWLEDPSEARDILLDSIARGKSANSHPRRTRKSTKKSLSSATAAQRSTRRSRGEQGGKRSFQFDFEMPVKEEVAPEPPYAPSLGIVCSPSSLAALASRDIELAIVALGFEERAFVSAQRLLSAISPRRVAMVHYSHDQGEAIRDLIAQRGLPSQQISTAEEMRSLMAGLKGGVVVDLAGLSKPYLFVSVKEALSKNKNVTVVHTLADRYYPSNEELESSGVFDAQCSAPLERLSDVLMGEEPPYRLIQVFSSQAAPERWQSLLASASPKNDRLLHLLDARNYDAARILVPPPSSLRRRVARVSAELAASAADANVALIEVDTNDLEGAIRRTEEIYKELYYSSGANVEIGLTGSKMHAVASAALAAAARISSAWYVTPQTFNRNRFTTGAGETRCMDLRLVG